MLLQITSSSSKGIGRYNVYTYVYTYCASVPHFDLSCKAMSATPRIQPKKEVAVSGLSAAHRVCSAVGHAARAMSYDNSMSDNTILTHSISSPSPLEHLYEEEMNLFLLDKNPALAAIYHCDKHVVKMILEITQILTTVWHLCASGKKARHKCCKSDDDGTKYWTEAEWQTVYKMKTGSEPYRRTHVHHPLVGWTASSEARYKFVACFGLEVWFSAVMC